MRSAVSHIQVQQDPRHLLHTSISLCMPMVQLTADVFEELNNSRPELKAIHAGECASGSPQQLPNLAQWLQLYP
jgi:di/tripeptidase